MLTVSAAELWAGSLNCASHQEYFESIVQPRVSTRRRGRRQGTKTPLVTQRRCVRSAAHGAVKIAARNRRLPAESRHSLQRHDKRAHWRRRSGASLPALFYSSHIRAVPAGPSPRITRRSRSSIRRPRSRTTPSVQPTSRFARTPAAACQRIRNGRTPRRERRAPQRSGSTGSGARSTTPTVRNRTTSRPRRATFPNRHLYRSARLNLTPLATLPAAMSVAATLLAVASIPLLMSRPLELFRDAVNVKRKRVVWLAVAHRNAVRPRMRRSTRTPPIPCNVRCC